MNFWKWKLCFTKSLHPTEQSHASIHNSANGQSADVFGLYDVEKTASQDSASVKQDLDINVLSQWDYMLLTDVKYGDSKTKVSKNIADQYKMSLTEINSRWLK